MIITHYGKKGSKMKKGFFALVVLAGVFWAWGAALAEVPWKLVMDKDGIRAYARMIPGTNVQETRAVMTVDATLATVNAVMRDFAGYPEWFPYYKKAELAEERSKYDLDVYLVLGLPWPARERDMVMNCKAVYDLKAARGVVYLKAVENAKFPPNSKDIRIKNFTGSYVFEYISRDKTGVVFTFNMDMGGWIPTSVLNIMAKYNLYNTFVGMRRVVKKPSYIEAGKRSDERDIVSGVVDSDANIKEVFRLRLQEFIGDRTFVDKVVDDPALRESFFAPKNALSENILYGWGSEKSKKEAITRLLQSYLPRHAADPKAAEGLASDKEVVETILSGRGSFIKVLAARNCTLK